MRKILCSLTALMLAAVLLAGPGVSAAGSSARYESRQQAWAQALASESGELVIRPMDPWHGGSTGAFP